MPYSRVTMVTIVLQVRLPIKAVNAGLMILSSPFPENVLVALIENRWARTVLADNDRPYGTGSNIVGRHRPSLFWCKFLSADMLACVSEVSTLSADKLCHTFGWHQLLADIVSDVGWHLWSPKCQPTMTGHVACVLFCCDSAEHEIWFSSSW